MGKILSNSWRAVILNVGLNAIFEKSHSFSTKNRQKWQKNDHFGIEVVLKRSKKCHFRHQSGRKSAFLHFLHPFFAKKSNFGRAPEPRGRNSVRSQMPFFGGFSAGFLLQNPGERKSEKSKGARFPWHFLDFWEKRYFFMFFSLNFKLKNYKNHVFL